MSNSRAFSDDVTLVEPISNDFTNRRFAIFIWICIDYVLFTIAITYRAFEAFSQTIRPGINDSPKQ